jgi:hypothetical protein
MGTWRVISEATWSFRMLRITAIKLHEETSKIGVSEFCVVSLKMRGSYWKSWAKPHCKVTCFISDKPNTQPQSTYLSLFFHIITTSLFTFLPAFWEFENYPSVKFRSSHSKTLTNWFLNCLPCLKTLSTQLMLHKSEKMVVGGCQMTYHCRPLC